MQIERAEHHVISMVIASYSISRRESAPDDGRCF